MVRFGTFRKLEERSPSGSHRRAVPQFFAPTETRIPTNVNLSSSILDFVNSGNQAFLFDPFDHTVTLF